MTWLRSSLRRLRDAPATAVGFGLLLFVTTFLFAAAPRAIDALATRTVRAELRAATPVARNVELTRITRLEPTGSDPLDSVRLGGDALAGQLPPSVRAAASTHRFVVDTPRWAITTPRPEPGTLTFRFQEGVPEAITYTAGRPPTGATRQAADAPDLPGLLTTFEGALSEETAAALQAQLGDVIDLAIDETDVLVRGTGVESRCRVQIVGLFRPADSSAPVWYAENGLLRASTRVFGPSVAILDVRLLMAPDAYRPVMAATDVANIVLRYTWRFFVDPYAIEARDLPGLTADLRRTESTFPKLPSAARAVDSAQLTSALADLLAGFDERWSFATAIMATGAAGPAAMAIVAVGFIALLGARRRRPVLAAWRARGASTTQVLLGTAAEGVVIGAPAAALAAAGAIVLVPGGQAGPSLLAGGAVFAAGVLLVALLETPPALVAKGRVSSSPADGAPSARSSGRRQVVLELLVVALAVAAIALLRSRGADSGGEPVGPELPATGALAIANPFLAAAPALACLAAAVAARRLIPLPIRALAALAAQGRGLPTALAMRRASRQNGSGAVMAVLLASAAITAFTAATVLSLDHGADVVAWQDVGADYHVTIGYGSLPEDFDPSALPGVEASAVAFRGTANVATDLGAYDLLAIEAPAYAALVRGTPADRSLPAEMLDPDPDTVPVILSSVVAARAGVQEVGQKLDVRVRSRRIPAHVAAIRDAFPSLPVGGTFVVISRSHLLALDPTLDLQPTDVYMAVSPAARDALLGTLSHLGPAVQVASRAEETATLRDQPVNRTVAIVVLAAAVAGAFYAVLALVAGLALAGSARSNEVAHLRMLGLAPREGTALVALEFGPVVGLALLAGTILGVGLFEAIRGALGLGRLLGSPLDIPLAIAPGPFAVIVLATGAITGAAIALAGALQGRAAPVGAVRRGIE
jgi:putative ABC transport system permease protein